MFSSYTDYFADLYHRSATIPAIMYIDRWGRRPMLLCGSIAMCIWLFLVGGLQAGFGHPSTLLGESTTTWVVEGNKAVTCEALLVHQSLPITPQQS